MFSVGGCCPMVCVGKLILTSVTKVLLAPQQRSTETVYEAIILQKQNFDYDGKGRDFIYLCLSPQWVLNYFALKQSLLLCKVNYHVCICDYIAMT